MHKYVSVPGKAWKAGPDDGLAEGQFRAVVSVFNNVDSYGDVVRPGAFAESIKDWEASGSRIPIYWSHQLNDPDMNIGWVEKATETDAGLEVLGQLDLEEGASRQAQQTYRLLKGRRCEGFSFSYEVTDGSPVEENGTTINELRGLKLYEVSPCVVPANAATELLAVKANTAALVADLKAGRVLSGKNESTLRGVLDSLSDSTAQLQNVLAALDKPDDGKATTPAAASAADPAKDEEPSGAKSEEPSPRASVNTWAIAIQLALLETSHE